MQDTWKQDAATLAGWGVDFVKTDNCNHPDPSESNKTIEELFTAVNGLWAAGGCVKGKPLVTPIFSGRCESGTCNIHDRSMPCRPELRH